MLSQNYDLIRALYCYSLLNIDIPSFFVKVTAAPGFFKVIESTVRLSISPIYVPSGL